MLMAGDFNCVEGLNWEAYHAWTWFLENQPIDGNYSKELIKKINLEI